MKFGVIRAIRAQKTKNPLTIPSGSGLPDTAKNYDDTYMGGPPIPVKEHMSMQHIIIDSLFFLIWIPVVTIAFILTAN